MAPLQHPSEVNDALRLLEPQRAVPNVMVPSASGLTTSECQVAAYALPATGAVVVVVGWHTRRPGASTGRAPLDRLRSVRRPSFECFAGRGAGAPERDAGIPGGAGARPSLRAAGSARGHATRSGGCRVERTGPVDAPVPGHPRHGAARVRAEPLRRRLVGDRPVLSVKRSASPSPATGSAKAHEVEQKALLTLALTTNGH